MMHAFSSLLDSVPPEGRLMVECISPSLTHAARARAIEQVVRGVDWERLIDYATGHFVIPPVYTILAEHADLIPPGTIKNLRLAYGFNATKQKSLAHELLQVSTELASVGASS